MQDFEKLGVFYLGKIFDPSAGQVTDQPILYDAKDLTTHAVVVGMTGSGKTGLLITLLEEAALQGLPAIVIDPKGDLTNLLLHFPDLLPADFEPWIDPEAARRAGRHRERHNRVGEALQRVAVGEVALLAELIGAGKIGICEVSYNAHGFKGKEVPGLRYKDFVTQAFNAEMVDECDRYVTL